MKNEKGYFLWDVRACYCIELTKDQSFGRSECTHIFPHDLQMSYSHCRISHKAKKWHLIDLESTNGTYLNKEEAEIDGIKELKPLDIIQIGNRIFVFLTESFYDFKSRKSFLKEMKPFCNATLFKEITHRSILFYKRALPERAIRRSIKKFEKQLKGLNKEKDFIEVSLRDILIKIDEVESQFRNYKKINPLAKIDDPDLRVSKDEEDDGTIKLYKKKTKLSA